MNKEGSRGSVWGGPTLKPMAKQKDNYIVLATDYENYAITYQCTEKSVMYNQDIITVLFRDPNLKMLQSGTLEKVKEDFYRLVGHGRPA